MNLPEFKNPPSLLKATYHINTPMFAAGADTKEAELTPTSFKGVMRFWWRALNWSNIRIHSSSDDEALKELYKQESVLFGVAINDKRKGQGQGACLINTLSLSSQAKWRYQNSKHGLNYLLGQGLCSSREAINPNQAFSIEFTVERQYHDAIVDVLRLVGLLGGVGSRSRHGLGSVTLTSLEVKKAQQDNYESVEMVVDDAVSELKSLLHKYQCRENNNLPPLSAFYAGTRIDIINTTNSNAVELLDALGEEQQMYRSYGHNGSVNGKQAERNFQYDHDLVLSLADGSYQGIAKHPKRVVFGLPHNYFFSSNKVKADFDSITGRRASPLFFHIHKKSAQEYQVILCLLKSQFLPEGASIKFSTKKRKNLNIDIEPDWQVITSFMDRSAFANKETLQ